MIIWAIVALYERVVGRVQINTSLSAEVMSTIGVKHGCPLSPTLFSLYIDEFETTIRTLGDICCSLAEAIIQILLYVDNIVLPSSFATGV